MGPGLMQVWFGGKISKISYVKPIEKYHAFEPWTGYKSQIFSQGKLTTLRCENKLIRHEN
jgi:hypothetical protein